MNKKYRLFILFIPLMIFVVGCVFLFKGLYTDPQKLESVLVGKRVPDFTLQSLYDPAKQYDASIFKGKKMLLNVWATWCPTCYAEHGFLNNLANNGIYIVGMNYKDSRIKAIRWLNELHDPYKISLFDEDGMLGLDLGVYGAPETFFIDSKGVIRYRHIGNLDEVIWRSKLEKIFNEME
ncbi:DsbE family thiol:disulfide interchange protein [Psychromonas sp. CD1]|uniref:DsbE family thiol:disulfide interchange protein n=1 Tax=Psychromonas sp. CD1 TaxID=1979839 RepID=UPI000B9AC675|nr:DsbE family thiol:disulfide interchange protein [Psychromonas sp. CD1]